MNDYDEKISISEVFGLIGEHCTEKYLTENMDCFARADTTSFLGSSFLSPNHNQEFDVRDLHDIVQRCQKGSKLCEFDKEKRPCLKAEFFETNYDAHTYLNLSEADDDKMRWYCALRFSHLAIQQYGRTLATCAEKLLTDYLAACRSCSEAQKPRSRNRQVHF